MPVDNAQCERTRDAALYVLGELHGGQLDGFARHLRDCEQCGEEVELLEIASDAVPLLTARQIPAAGEAEADLRAAPPATAPRPALRPIAGGASGRPTAAGPGKPLRSSARRLIRPVPRSGLIGFMAVAVLAIATVAMSSQAAGIRYARIQAGWARGGAAIRLEGNRLELLVEGMPRPAIGTGYQVWVVDRATKRLIPTSAWIHLNQLGQAGEAVPGDYHQWDAVAVYVEPLAGPDSTHSGAAAVGDLRSVR